LFFHFKQNLRGRSYRCFLQQRTQAAFRHSWKICEYCCFWRVTRNLVFKTVLKRQPVP